MSGDMPLARNVAIPETMNVMNPDRRKLNRKGTNLGCMLGHGQMGEKIKSSIIECASHQAAI
tara:strand:- start:5140 stop:5325 length:186 start_codon:yes stop_codon:yes gene_type:complete